MDTSVLIDQLRGDDAAIPAIADERARSGPFMASTVTRFEVLTGMRAAERDATELLLATIEWIDVTPEVSDRAAAYAQRFGASHAGIDPLDYIIAATATVISGELWTRNVRHFPMFDGLTAPY